MVERTVCVCAQGRSNGLPGSLCSHCGGVIPGPFDIMALQTCSCKNPQVVRGYCEGCGRPISKEIKR